MITIHIPDKRLFFSETNTFYDVKKVDLTMEHSLLSLKKWESRWKIPFLGRTPKTNIQMLDYLKCMTLTKLVDQNAYLAIPDEEMKRIVRYIKDPMCATTFTDNLIGAQRNRNEVVTAETIYYWMITLNIPVEFQKWHLEQLLALIKLTNIKNDPKKRKMSEREVIAKYAEINERNKKLLNTKG